MNSTLLQSLRRETEEQHQILEDAFGLLRPTIDLLDYHLYLSSMEAFLKPWEATITTSPYYKGRSKLSFLESDLRYFGIPTAIPLSIPPLNSEEQILGSMYVIEGSTLGGSYLSSLLAERWQLSPTQGMAYLTCYGATVATRWREFCKLLDDRQDHVHHVSVIASAQHVFNQILQYRSSPDRTAVTPVSQ